MLIMVTKASPSISMFSRWQLAIKLFWQHFPLVYPIFGFFVLMNFIVPANINSSLAGLNWQWLLLLIGQYCLWFLLEAGWTYMAFTTTQKYLNTPEAERNWASISDSFGVLKNFFHGVGHFGLTFLITGFVELILTLLPWASIAFVGYKLIGLPQHVVTLWVKMLTNGLPEQTTALSQQNYASQCALLAM